MKHNLMGIVSGVLMVLLTFSGCSPKRGEDKKPESIALEAEESESQLTLDQVYDEVLSGSHLVLAYNKESHVLTGTVENVSDQVLKRVRVEVHLSNGSKLGPATQLDLQPGEKRLILLEAGSGDFTTWSAHAEIESGEHGHEHAHGEGEHSHSHTGDSHSHTGDSHGEHSPEGEGTHEHN